MFRVAALGLAVPGTDLQRGFRGSGVQGLGV